MLNQTWREQTWSDLDQPWDLIVIGGGITGAGIFNQAAQKGLRVLLLEANDFAFGTSSRSSKLVHGGIRYLKNRQFDVVLESVKERERMLRESDGLVDPLAFVFPAYEHNARDVKMMQMGVTIYDLMVPKWQHNTLNQHQAQENLPGLNGTSLIGGIKYYDAIVDDSQLVLRVITDGIRFGGSAINYARVVQLSKSASGTVEGVIVEDKSGKMTPSQVEVRARVVVNATGPWSDELREHIHGSARLRRLRGSHLIFSREAIPLNAAVTMLHPRDNRALFAIPWENRTLIGTTDLDHDLYEDETRITVDEIAYLLEAARHAFPEHPVSEADIISTFSGLRPVINTNAAHPSLESRAHKIWREEGLVTVTGGKLTIFRVMAADVLNFCAPQLPGRPKFHHRAPCFIHPQPLDRQNHANLQWGLMAGRLGMDVNAFFQQSDPEDLAPIEPINLLWAELSWAAKNEAVLHLDDLLLRRVRLGILFPNGGLDLIEQVRTRVQSHLGWSDATWAAEVERYREIWQENYYLSN
ncbi:MAG: glycerol-3-phosphate dehydrogenase/oxidase [Chloroflexi bacterium]|nr:glycerol-3-phosphate dehydrogenase/oxidase [Chloroflexota bacterium]